MRGLPAGAQPIQEHLTQIFRQIAAQQPLLISLADEQTTRQARL